MVAMDAVTNWVQKTTCHGFVDLYDSKNWIQKLFWGAVIIAAFGAIVFYQMSAITYYSTVPTATKISKITTDRLEFPLVTICQQHPVNMQKYLKLYASFASRFPQQFSLGTPYGFLGYISLGAGYYSKLGQSILTTPDQSTKLPDPMEEVKYQLIFKSTPPAYDLVQFLDDISHSCEDFFTQMIGDCRITSAYFDCCKSATRIRTDLGNCYEIRPIVAGLGDLSESSITNGNVNQMQPGSDWGMYLLLQYDSSNTPQFPMASIKNEGYEITIGEQMTKMDTSRITVGPNQQVSVYLKLERYQFDPTITTCVDIQADLTQTESERKSVSLCKQECLFNGTLSRAHCVPVNPNMKLNSSICCTPLQMIKSFYTIETRIFNKNFLDEVFACQQTRCPKLCTMDLYVPFAVYSVVKNISASTAISIYYGELSYTLIVEKPLMDLPGLISSFGGNLGLFAGMSLITIVQFFAHLIQGCGAALLKRNKQKSPIEAIEIYGKPANDDHQKNPEDTVHHIPVSYPVHRAPRPIHL